MNPDFVITICKKYYPNKEDINVKAKLLAIICHMPELEILKIIEMTDIQEGTEIQLKAIKQDALQNRESILSLNEIDSLEIVSLESLRSRQLKGSQRSLGWLNERTNYITASVSAACAGSMGPAARESQILNKASNGSYQPFKGGYYTDMGNIFEDVTADHYSRLHLTKIHDFRLIPHNSIEYSFLGASTDGVTDSLINIEIKTLAGRELDPHIKKEYGHQMQHQMECLNLKKTHFLEAKYETFLKLDDAFKFKAIAQGVILEFWREDSFYYVYSENNESDIEILKAWEETESVKSEGIYIRSIYWSMIGYQEKTVLYDPKWIINMGPHFKKFWEEVNYLRDNPLKLEERIRIYEGAKTRRREIKYNTLPSDICLI